MRDDVQKLLTLLKEHLTEKLHLIDEYRENQETLQRLISSDKTEEIPQHLEAMEALSENIKNKDYHAGSLYDEIARTTGSDRYALFELLQETGDREAESVLDLEDLIHKRIRELAQFQQEVIIAMQEASMRYRFDAEEISRILRLHPSVKKHKNH